MASTQRTPWTTSPAEGTVSWVVVAGAVVVVSPSPSVATWPEPTPDDVPLMPDPVPDENPLLP